MILTLCLQALPAVAQVENWDSTGIPVDGVLVDDLYVDTVDDVMYALGILLDSTNTWNDQVVLRYDGSAWTKFGDFDGGVFTMIRHGNDLIFGGWWLNVDGQPIPNLVKYDGVSWSSFGDFNNPVRRLRHLDGELYAMGHFDTIDGVHINSIAKWNGASWEGVPDFPFYNISTVTDAEIYQGDLYVAGNLYDTLGGEVVHDMVVYQNGQWQKVGQGIEGMAGGVNKLAVFKGELYAGGLIWQPDGNVGSLVQKWDGNVWTNVGTGLQGYNNDSLTTCQVRHFDVIDSFLYVTGNFVFADHVPAFALARWDGEQWCGFGTTGLIEQATCVAKYHDTLYLGTEDSLGSLYVNHLAKYVAGNSVDTCGPLRIVGVEDIAQTAAIRIYPNPMSESATIEFDGEVNESYTFTLYDNLGRAVLVERFRGNRHRFTRSSLKAGLYHYAVASDRVPFRLHGSVILTE